MKMTALQNDVCPKHSFLPHSNRELVAIHYIVPLSFHRVSGLGQNYF